MTMNVELSRSRCIENIKGPKPGLCGTPQEIQMQRKETGPDLKDPDHFRL